MRANSDTFSYFNYEKKHAGPNNHYLPLIRIYRARFEKSGPDYSKRVDH